MREVSIHTLQPKEESDKEDALKKICEGLEALAKINLDTSQAVLEAVKVEPPNVDVEAIVKPLIETLSKKHSATGYTFKMNRNSANLLTSVEAIPNESR